MHVAFIRHGRRLAFAWLMLLAVVRPAGAQAPPDPAELARKLEQSLRQIEMLNARVEQLERQVKALQPPAPAVAASAADASTAARLQQVEKAVSQLASADLRPATENTGTPLHGFLDTTAVAARRAPPGARSGYAIGSLDFYLTPEIGERVKTLVELNFGVVEGGETEVDLERAQIGYTFSDALTLWLGRFHTPMGYWNMAYHHGAEIQTSVLRPRLLDFEDDGGLLPVHTTGLWATGAARLGTDRVVYHLYTGNGTRIHNGQLDPNPAGDDNGNKVLGAAFSWRFGGPLDGWTAGANALTQTVNATTDDASLAARLRLRVFGAYAVYENNGWEAMAEGYAFRNRDLSGAGSGHDSWGAYAQVGRTIADRWVPYVRLERASLDLADPYFATLANGRFEGRQVLGLRYNAEARAALKLELSRTRQRAPALDLDEMRLQYAIGF